MRIVILALAAATMAGCATMEVKVPVTGQMGDGTPAAGQAVARGDGNGSFWVETATGLRCSGSYDSLDTNPTIIVPVTCDDGRSGRTIITRQIDGRSGTAIVTLSDGERGQFVFGDLRFDQAFGTAAAQTAPAALGN